MESGPPFSASISRQLQACSGFSDGGIGSFRLNPPRS